MNVMELSEIRQVRQSEIPEVVDFCMNIVREVFPLLDPEVPPIDLLKLEETYIVPSRATFIAAYSKTGRVVGTIAARPYDGRIPHLKGHYDLASTVEIVRCFVGPELRRSGLGSMMVGQLIPFCQEAGYQTLYLHTHKFLPGALDFWKNQGFSIKCEDDDPKWQTVHMDRLGAIC